jgi:hypothetical protein
LHNLYWIKNKKGQKVKFEPNWAQKEILENLHYFNIILKARQLGITTLFAIYFLDMCLWNCNINAAIVADIQKNSLEIFQDKVKFAYDNLHPIIKEISPARRDNANELRFENGSVYRVGTSLRSGTLQLLHVSEFGKICRWQPQKAEEIVSGALNTVQSGQFITIESTAEGREGKFFEMVQRCQEKQLKGEPLTNMDWKLFFLPWYKEPMYTLEKDVILA